MRNKKVFFPKGFTLIEVLVAMALLVFGVVAVVKVMSSGLAADNTVDGQTIALNLAQQKMETLKSTAYASLASSSGTFSSPWAAYNYTITVTPIDPSGSLSYLKQVLVTVSWTYKGKSLSVSLTSVFSNNIGSCGSGYSSCSGTCVNKTSDASHCGSCATVCGGTTPACCGSLCYDLDSNVNHCGSCGVSCGISCTAGICYNG